MKNKKVLQKTTLTLIILTFGVSAVFAAKNPSCPVCPVCASQPISQGSANSRQGWFLGLSGGTFVATVDTSSTSTSYSSLTGGGGGFLSFGYQTGPHFAYEYDTIVGGISDTETFDAVGGGNVKAKTDTLGVLTGPAIKGIATLGKNFMIYGRLGVGYVKVSNTATPIDKSKKISNHIESESGVWPFDGVGMSYAINKKIDINLDYTGLIAIIANAGLVSGGIIYHF